MSPNLLYGRVYFDSCAFDGGSIQEQDASIKAIEYYEEHGHGVELVHSVAKEIEFPNTPQWVKSIADDLNHTYEVNLSQQEMALLARVEEVVVGNGSIEKMRSDCRHIFEAQKYGRYFVTTDKRLLKKAALIKSNFTLYVIRPTEFLKTLERDIEQKT